MEWKESIEDTFAHFSAFGHDEPFPGAGSRPRPPPSSRKNGGRQPLRAPKQDQLELLDG